MAALHDPEGAIPKPTFLTGNPSTTDPNPPAAGRVDSDEGESVSLPSRMSSRSRFAAHPPCPRRPASPSTHPQTGRQASITAILQGNKGPLQMASRPCTKRSSRWHTVHLFDRRCATAMPRGEVSTGRGVLLRGTPTAQDGKPLRQLPRGRTHPNLTSPSRPQARLDPLLVPGLSAVLTGMGTACRTAAMARGECIARASRR